jgi:hypothetical protein
MVELGLGYLVNGCPVTPGQLYGAVRRAGVDHHELELEVTLLRTDPIEQSPEFRASIEGGNDDRDFR